METSKRYIPKAEAPQRYITVKKAIEHILTNEKYTGSVIVMKTKHSDRHKVEINNGEKYLAADIHPAIIGKVMFARTCVTSATGK